MPTRRRLLRAAAGACAAATLPRPGRGSGRGSGQESGRAAGRCVTVLAYDGLIPAPFKAQFEAETGIEIRVQTQFSQAPELNLLIAGRDRPSADLCTVAGARLHQFLDNGIIEPLDVARLRHWGRIDPAYSQGAWLRVGGATMGVPLSLSCERLVSNTGRVSPDPQSWSALFDPRCRGRTTYVIEDMLQCTMLLQGADGDFASYLAIPDQAQKAVDAARDALIAAKPQVVTYYEDGAELVQMLAGKDAWLAQCYAGAPTKLILAGQPFRLTVPREGSLGSVYTFAVVKDAPNRDGAYRLLDALLADPGIGAAMTRASGLPSCFLGAEAALSALERQAFLLTPAERGRIRIRGGEGQALNSRLIDRAVEEVKAG